MWKLHLILKKIMTNAKTIGSVFMHKILALKRIFVAIIYE